MPHYDEKDIVFRVVGGLKFVRSCPELHPHEARAQQNQQIA